MQRRVTQQRYHTHTDASLDYLTEIFKAYLLYMMD
ncbi:hypothetical protein Pecwa_1837 [Pectobacterium parmentieri WPP163]|uniref:Uncharacterized protein n=1 Tax=Pectobacterium parmentieri TaxID=1905730 RepID=A0A0H3I7D7_PECPM|nr:hypothetical protein Pecwa_1837 [Pectobacterium parmentieri WPP163]AFI89841.1 Hypothetical protein W5S_1750 [Pectobacterium parmentieri]